MGTINILITGGTGFVGSNIAKYFINKGHHVLMTGHTGENENNNKNIISYSFHDLNWNKLPKIDILFHQAAITDTLIHDREKMLEVNFWQSRQLIDQAINAGVTRIVYASSAATYGDTLPPFKEEDAGRCLNVYAESKLLLDRYCEIITQTKDICVIGLRYSNVYGPGESHKGQAKSMIAQIYEQMLNGNPKLFRWGEQKRDFVYVDDVVAANVLASQSNLNGVFNVGSGTSVTFNRIVDILNEYSRLDREIEYIDNYCAINYQNHTRLDLTQSQEQLKYVPQYTIERGIKEYLFPANFSTN